MDPMDPPMKWAIRTWGLIMWVFGAALGWQLHNLFG